MKKTMLLIFMIGLITSCSNELDRSDAEKMIIEQFNYPYVEFQKLPKTTSSEQLNSTYQKARAEKLMTSRLKGKYGNNFYIILTPKGKAFTNPSKPYNYGWNVATNLVDFKDITGIRFNDAKTSASVEFTTEKKEVTTFGQIKKIKEGQTESEQVNFVLYDDGWRIQSEPKTVIKKDEIDGFDQSKLTELNNILNEITLETGDSYFLLKETYSKYGKNFIKVDYVGVDGSNTNPKLRTFLIDESFYKEDYCGPFGKGFITSFNDVKTKIGSQRAYIQVVDGIVKCIDVDTAG